MMPRLPLPQRQAAHHEPSQSAQHPSFPNECHLPSLNCCCQPPSGTGLAFAATIGASVLGGDGRSANLNWDCPWNANLDRESCVRCKHEMDTQ